MEGHESLRADYQSSIPEADAIVELAMAHGAHGARLTGAGWGGAVVVLAPEERSARVLAEIAKGFKRRSGGSRRCGARGRDRRCGGRRWRDRGGRRGYIPRAPAARVAKLVDAWDLKSSGGNPVRVRIPPRALIRKVTMTILTRPALAGFLFAITFIATASTPDRALAQRTGPEADSIAQLVARYDSSWNGQDTTGIRRLLSPDYQYFSSRGAVWGLKDVMGMVGSADYKLERARRSEIGVTVSGSTAIVSSRWQGNGTYRGKPFTDDQRCGLVWVRDGRGVWRLLSEHCVQIVGGSSG